VTQKTGERSAKAVAKPGRPLENLETVSFVCELRCQLEDRPAIGCHKANAHFSRDFGIAFSSLNSCGLMSRIDELDPNIMSTHEEGVKMAAVESKGHIGSKNSQRLGEEISSIELSVLWDLESGHVCLCGLPRPGAIDLERGYRYQNTIERLTYFRTLMFILL
jgi:hypothetical protein